MAVRDAFYAVPLRQLAPDHAAAEMRFAANLEKLADSVEAVIPWKKVTE